MRLSQYEIESIKVSAGRHFGAEVQVFLFGSRVDDSAHGGDIDLFIKAESDRLNSRNRIAFITDLIMRVGERRIDVVLDNEKRETEQFFKTIEKTAVKLC
jgi:uncharacterized protein